MDFRKRTKKRARRLQSGRKFSFEVLEQRSLLSASPIDVDHVGFFTSAPAAETTTVPAQIAGKVDSHYWELAEDLNVASRHGTRSGEDLR